MRARFLTAALLAAVCAVSTGCARKPQQPLVGVYLALTGDMADFGITTRQGIELAAEEINAAGGINGQRLRLLVEDNRGKPEEARTVVTKLIDQQGVVAVLGEVAS
ncbi:MAG: ABC transporter substrate-binding protein, partial [Armatimonadota bacterium]